MPSIIAAIEQQERLANSNGALSEDRQKALDLYLGRPYGDEQDGRSKVVMRDVADTIEWIKPSLVKVFCSGDEVAKFNPVGFEDEEQAQQETDYVNHVIQQKNDGFLIFYDWFHDALLQKNGYTWVKNCEERHSSRSTYKGLTDDEFAMLMQGPDRELVEHSQYVDEAGMVCHDAVVRRVNTYQYPKILNIPPERVLVAADWPHLRLMECPFVEVIDWPTISDLRNEGYDVPDDINDAAQYSDDEYEEHQRQEPQLYHDRRDLETVDPSTRRVKTRYVWIKFDADGDGIAELRHVVLVGKTPLNGKDGEEDDHVPVASISPIRMPHEHVGQSIADIVEDLQRIRTVLVRGYLDNMYLANNGRHAIDANRVNLDDLLTTRPGGVIRVDGSPGDSYMPVVHPQIGSDILQAVEYVDTVRENRTGVTRYNQGMDANSLNKTASGINNIMNAAAQRIELIARLFAETGVKHLMLIVHAATLKYSSQAEKVKLRNQWVPIDPRTWSTRTDMTVSVGLGNGNKDQMIQQLMLIAQMQSQGLPIGIATAKNIYNTAKRFTQNAGFKNADEFWTDPEQNPPAPPPPDPQVVKAQIDAQAKQQDMQIKAVESERELAHKERIAQIDERMKQMDLLIKEREMEMRERDLQLQAQESAMKINFAMVDSDLKTKQAMNGLEIERKKAQEYQIEPDPRIDQLMQMFDSFQESLKGAVEDLMGQQVVGFDRDPQSGRVAGVRRRNGNVTPVSLDERGRVIGLQ